MADGRPDIPQDWLAEFEAAARRPLELRWRYAFIKTYKPVLTTPRTGRSTRWKTSGGGARRTSRAGSAMAAFEYGQAQEVRDAFARHGVRYLFIGKSGLILLGFADTDPGIELFAANDPGNAGTVVAALRELGFTVDNNTAAEIERGKDFVQLKDGPFDLDLVFAPDGIERFEQAWARRVVVEGFPVCHPDDIIASKAAANRAKDRESLPRLRAFREYWVERQQGR